MKLLKQGTIIELPDGRRGTVVYNGLDGQGIKWGEHIIPEGAIQGTGNTVGGGPPPDYEYFADALLREPYNGADLECVGEEYTVIKIPQEAPHE